MELDKLVRKANSASATARVSVINTTCAPVSAI